MNHSEINKDGSARFAPTTLRSWLSLLGKFWEFTQRGDLKAQMPLLESQIGKWEKDYMIKRARTFSNADLGTSFSLFLVTTLKLYNIYIFCSSFA